MGNDDGKAPGGAECSVEMEETMIAARKSILFAIAALSLLAGLSGCIVAERGGPGWHSHHSHSNWHGNGDWHGNGGWNGYR